MTEATQPVDSARGARSAAGWRHFAVAAGVLLVVGVGWNAVAGIIGIYLAKDPVPPPERVQTDQHRLVSFPQRVGPYVVAADGELFLDRRTGLPIRDGQPDGISTFPDDVLETLGTARHELNWYYSGIFRDTRPQRSGRYLRMDVTYYTGLLDAVPHVPTNCIVAGGGTILRDQSKPIVVSIPAAPEPWRRITVYRTAYQVSASAFQGVSAQYHVFSMNGTPTHDRFAVRMKLGLPWVKYAYFAKIQVAPLRPEASLEETDRVCLEFIRVVLPEVLKYLPSEADVRRLEASGRS